MIDSATSMNSQKFSGFGDAAVEFLQVQLDYHLGNIMKNQLTCFANRWPTGRLSRIILVASCCLIAATPADAAWPQFLGPQRNGISTEVGLLAKWPEGGPKEVWRAETGEGMAGLAIDQGRLVTTYQKGQSQYLAAFDAKTGRRIWEVSVAPAYKNQMGDGPRATPTISGETVFMFSGQGILEAHRLSDGETIWSHDVIKELGGKPADYGMACSPLVVGEQVVVTAGAPQATVVACDAKTGEFAWKSGNDRAGYSSPALLEIGGRKQIVVFSGNSLLGLTPGSGELLWRYPFETDFDCNIVTPIEYKGNVFISSGESHGSAMLAVKPNGETFDVEEVWTSLGTKSVMRNQWHTSLLINGYLYGIDNVGASGPIAHLACVNADTGERVWQKLRFGKSNMIAADGKLFMSTMEGELVIGRATPKGYEELGRKVVLDTIRQAPALCDGLLYLSDRKEIACFDVRDN